MVCFNQRLNKFVSSMHNEQAWSTAGNIKDLFCITDVNFTTFSFCVCSKHD